MNNLCLIYSLCQQHLPLQPAGSKQAWSCSLQQFVCYWISVVLYLYLNFPTVLAHSDSFCLNSKYSTMNEDTETRTHAHTHACMQSRTKPQNLKLDSPHMKAANGLHCTAKFKYTCQFQLGNNFQSTCHVTHKVWKQANHITLKYFTKSRSKLLCPAERCSMTTVWPKNGWHYVCTSSGMSLLSVVKQWHMSHGITKRNLNNNRSRLVLHPNKTNILHQMQNAPQYPPKYHFLFFSETNRE